MRFVVAITAASGAIYARLTIERLLASPCAITSRSCAAATPAR